VKWGLNPRAVDLIFLNTLKFRRFGRMLVMTLIMSYWIMLRNFLRLNINIFNELMDRRLFCSISLQIFLK